MRIVCRSRTAPVYMNLRRSKGMLVLKIVITILLVGLALMFGWASSGKDTKPETRLGAMVIAIVEMLSVLAIWG